MRRIAIALTCAAAVYACAGKPSEAELVASARAYLEKRDAKSAIIQLKSALDLNNGAAETRLLLGKALLQDNDPAGAEIELRRALDDGAMREQVVPLLAHTLRQLDQNRRLVTEFGSETLPDPGADIVLKLNIASAYAQLGDRARAKAVLAPALQAHPDHVDAALVAARLAAMDGAVEEALRLLDAVLAKDSAHEHAGPAKADLLWLAKNDKAGALALHRSVLSKHPRSIASHSSVISILFADGRLAQAKQHFEQMKTTAPKHPETLFFEAQFAYVDNDYRRSRELTDLVLTAVPDHVRALELAAAAEYQAGDDALAQSFTDRALRLRPGLPLARQIAARSLLRTGQADKAIAMLQPVLADAAVDGATLVLAGEIFLQLGDARKADVAFERASKLAPEDSNLRTRIALSQLGTGTNPTALKALQAIALGDPGGRADLALISAHMARGDAAGALAAIDRLAKKKPESPLPDQLRGQLLISKRDAEGARRSFEAALAKDARFMPAINALASLDLLAGQTDAARKRFTDLLAADPRNVQAILALSEIAVASGIGTDEVRRYINDALRTAPQSPEIRRLQVTQLLKSGDSAAALSAAQQAVAVMTGHLGMLELLGRTQIAANEANQAVATFRNLVSLQPDNAAYQLQLAEAHLVLRESDPAERALRKALELDPGLNPARRALAQLAAQTKRISEARAIAQEWQQRSPKDAAAYALEGDIESSQGNWAATIAAYQTALKLSHASEAAIKLHAAFIAANRPADADRLAAEWEKTRPADPVFRFYLGDIAMRQRNLPLAEQHYRTVLGRQPNNAMALNNVAWLLLEQSKPGALDLARRADAVMPNRAPILDTLAAAQAAAGRIAEAVTTQKRALAGSPQDPRMKLKLARYLIRAGEKREAREHLEALALLGDRFDQQADVAALMKAL